MIGPCWRGEVDRLIVGADIELGEKKATKVVGASAGDGLKRGNLLSC